MRTQMPKYSIIVPVYNRPYEVEELLQSLSRQTLRDMEIIIVEDGSDVTCEREVRLHAKELPLRYFCKENGGPGRARNFGAERSQGQFLIVLDSDCVLPEGFLQAVDDELRHSECDAWGGPDRTRPDFTPVQKAIGYSMTSFLTTGGIRGGKRQLDKKFYPRSFNMGIRASLYRELGGFGDMRFGEDIDFSLRIYQSGARCRLFPEAWVWHKRRTDLKKFFKQVHNSGIARINLSKRHPGSLKPVHLLPTIFTLGVLGLLMISIAGFAMLLGNCHQDYYWLLALLPLAPLALFSLIILIDSSIRNRSLMVGLYSVPASFIQLIGYGTGFLRAWWLRQVCGRDEELQAFKDNFYK